MLEVLQPFAGELNGALDEARWATVRRPERACDHALNGTSRLWLRKLPARRRPLRLCMHFPRVANRIAWCWHDVELSRQLLEDLLLDRRGGRRGFGAAINRELKRLQEFNALQRVDSRPEGLWQAVTRRIGMG
jgi:hypothetical protein